MIFNLTGGKNPVGGYGAIIVTYPPSWQCYITDSTDRNMQISPSNNGSYVFYVPFADTWTVTATNGTLQYNQNVGITETNRTARADFYYTNRIPINEYNWTCETTYLFDDGLGNTDYASIANNQLLCSVPYQPNGYYETHSPIGHSTCHTIEAIDLTGYNKIRYNVSAMNMWGDFTNLKQSFAVSLNPLTVYNGGRIWEHCEIGYHELDISNITGSYRIQLVMNTTAAPGQWIPGTRYLVRVDEVELVP